MSADSSEDSVLYLSAREAAAELGVSPATLYAYVSRGMIRSEPVPGARAKRYRAEDVRALAERRAPPGKAEKRPRHVTAFSAAQPVLASDISLIAEGGLYYRGVDAGELARHASLESAAGLLWQTADYDAFAKDNLPPQVPVLKLLADEAKDAHPIDRCMAVLALAGAADEGAYNRTDQGLALAAARITRLMAALVSGGPLSARPIHDQFGDAWGLDEKGRALVRMALVLLADHELNASTFTLRCAVSTGASLYDGTIAALAALKGPLHGGASARAALQLQKLMKSGEVLSEIREQAAAGERFAGFGHTIYRGWDPRAKVLLEAVEEKLGETFFTREVPAYVQKAVGVAPNIDYGLAILTHLLKLPALAGIGLFAVGRSIGWAAHAREQMRERTLIRPRALYTGPAPKG
ncbi:putative citrate synthase [Tepidicaulis marinus]|uniref:citrate synthase (unknown stereospecificity) n=1 Tax=Tepidicaulis marinus TaxID=1333998 RepID=A0A081BAD5_9HYPH|nr:citrate synthase family protein [Tepidicaulis marinus]GAK45003.1 putative citrate synthase [Tepidicaulis marinus]